MNDGMESAAPPPAMMSHSHRMMMHMTFFWGKSAEILFHGWPGYDNLGMYIVALAMVFILSVAMEWLSHCKIIRRHSAAAAVAQTVMYAVRIGLAYMVMLAVMSFNAGVFLAAVAGHSVGFFFFGSSAFKKPAVAAVGDGGKEATVLPPMNCC